MLSKDLMKIKLAQKVYGLTEEMISVSSNKNTSSEELLNESQNNTDTSNIDFLVPNASSRENDLLELEKLDNLKTRCYRKSLMYIFLMMK